jgi:hypothetical protein
VPDAGVGVLAALVDVVGADRPGREELDHDQHLRGPDHATLVALSQARRSRDDDQVGPSDGAGR